MRSEKYKKILCTLSAETDVAGSCIVSRDGLVMYTSLEDIHAYVLAAMLATLLSSAEVAVEQIGGGAPEVVTVTGKTKNIVVTGAGSHAFLAVITPLSLDDVRKPIEQAARDIAAAVSEKT
jgi:predicted regulator of Ras-like GTPase activity (Roadblock/LC7/MglB family)